MIPPLNEALRDLLEKYVHAYGPNEMIKELQSVIDGIRDVQELDAQTVYTTREQRIVSERERFGVVENSN